MPPAVKMLKRSIMACAECPPPVDAAEELGMGVALCARTCGTGCARSLRCRADWFCYVTTTS